MSDVYISGVGAVSPAGWGVAALQDALVQDQLIPTQPVGRPGSTQALAMRMVPAPAVRPEFLAHPRIRRVSPLTQYAAGAALEAARALPEDLRKNGRLGVILAMQSGPVQYATRFYDEVLKDPATASPLLFPETVYSAPTSHLATLLGKPGTAYTVVGDPAACLDALAIGADWLAQERVDACLVVAAEEFNWLHSYAVWHFSHQAVLSAGAGALCLTRERFGARVKLAAITDAFPYTAAQSPALAARRMRAQLPPGTPGELLCDGLGGLPAPARAESAAWRDWPGRRLSPKRVLGEGLIAAAAWQCVCAAAAVTAGECPAANVSVVGCNQQAIGARFEPA